MKGFTYFVLVGILCLTSCSGGGSSAGKSSSTSRIGQGEDIIAMTNAKGRILTSACDLVPEATVASILGIQQGALELSDASATGANASHSSCFFMYDNADIRGNGILLQVMKNPLDVAEYPDYVEGYIESKISAGEKTVEGDTQPFREFNEFGDSGAYSYGAGKYFWQMGNTVILSIAFNTSHSEQDQLRIARSLATEMTQNYLNIMGG